MRAILAEGDQGRQGRDQRACAADIDAKQQRGIVGGELREQDCRGHVTDDLAGKHREHQRVFLQKSAHQIANSRNARHVARKDKEAEERAQQTVIHLTECFAIQEKQRNGNDDQTDPVRNDAEDHDQRKCEQHKVDDRAPCGQAFTPLFGHFQLGAGQEQTAQRDQCDGCYERDEHDAHKLARGDVEKAVQIQILRISKGGEHAAKVCGNVLHNEHERHVLLHARKAQHEVAKRQKGQKCHVVADEHRADKGHVHQRQHRHAQRARALHDLAREHREKANILERTHHSQGTEQTRQRAQVKIPDVCSVRRHDDSRDGSTCGSDQQHRVLLSKCADLAQRVLWMCNKTRKRSLLNHNKFLSPCKIPQREKLYYRATGMSRVFC